MNAEKPSSLLDKVHRNSARKMTCTVQLQAGGGTHESRILAGYYVFNANILFTFQAIRNLSAHLTYLCFGLFCKFFGDF